MRGDGYLAAPGLDRPAGGHPQPGPDRRRPGCPGPRRSAHDLGALGALQHPARLAALAEDAARSHLPSGTREGTNGWQRTGYGGPCPPIGRHRYFHKLYALDTELPDLGTPDKAALERAMHGHVLAQAELVGTYQKHKR